jgi:hypothetical protein
MKFREPKKLHRKSRVWGTRRLVAGIEPRERLGHDTYPPETAAMGKLSLYLPLYLPAMGKLYLYLRPYISPIMDVHETLDRNRRLRVLSITADMDATSEDVHTASYTC